MHTTGLAIAIITTAVSAKPNLITAWLQKQILHMETILPIRKHL